MIAARALLSATALLACTPGGGAPRAEARGKEVQMETIGEEGLRASREPGNALALVRVLGVELVAAGTRSEHVTADLAVERALCGAPPAQLEAFSFTSKGNTLVVAGRRYLMVLHQAQGYAPYGIGARVEVPPGREDEAVELHRKALAALGAPRP